MIKSKAQAIYLLANNAKVIGKISKKREIELWSIRKYIKELAKS